MEKLRRTKNEKEKMQTGLTVREGAQSVLPWTRDILYIYLLGNGCHCAADGLGALS